MVLFICGFMGCGKSYLLSSIKDEKHSVELVDSDDLIKSSHNIFSNFSDFIKSKGWDYFRSCEEDLIKSYCEKSMEQDTVISLGGGALNDKTISLIENCPSAKLVWINTSFEDCYSRIKDDSNRPLVKKGKEYLRDLYESRKDSYKKADYKIEDLNEVVAKGILGLFEFLEMKIDEVGRISSI